MVAPSRMKLTAVFSLVVQEFASVQPLHQFSSPSIFLACTLFELQQR
jgi:hypothetical protein